MQNQDFAQNRNAVAQLELERKIDRSRGTKLSAQMMYAFEEILFAIFNLFSNPIQPQTHHIINTQA